MTRYVQVPAGWWQDSKGRTQPPGSYLDPSRRVSLAASAESTRRSATVGSTRQGHTAQHSLMAREPAQVVGLDADRNP
jgi:hypothetical protein